MIYQIALRCVVLEWHPSTEVRGFEPSCCARAASCHDAAAPPSSVMNSRRFMSEHGGLPPLCAISAANRPVRSVFRTSNLGQRGRQVLGADLNCSEFKMAADTAPSLGDSEPLLDPSSEHLMKRMTPRESHPSSSW